MAKQPEPKDEIPSESISWTPGAAGNNQEAAGDAAERLRQRWSGGQNADAEPQDVVPLTEPDQKPYGRKALPYVLDEQYKHIHPKRLVDRDPSSVPRPRNKPPISPPGVSRDDAVTNQIDALLDGVSSASAYLDQAPRLAELSHRFRQQVAARLEPILNYHIQGMPHDDLDGKKAICEFVNGEVERFGLAVKCPNTPGLPGKLKATAGNWPGIGRFQFEVYIEGKREKPAVSDTLPVLELVDANPVKEHGKSWQETVGPKSARTGRKLTD